MPPIKHVMTKNNTIGKNQSAESPFTYLYVNLSVLNIQIENKHVAAMVCFTLFLFDHCSILPS